MPGLATIGHTWAIRMPHQVVYAAWYIVTFARHRLGGAAGEARLLDTSQTWRTQDLRAVLVVHRTTMSLSFLANVSGNSRLKRL